MNFKKKYQNIRISRQKSPKQPDVEQKLVNPVSPPISAYL